MKCHIEKAKQVIRKTLLTRRACCVPTSFGKDSSSVLNLVVTTAAEIVAEQGKEAIAPITVVNADTLVESPAMEQLLLSEVKKLKAYCSEHDVPLTFLRSKPALTSEWTVKVLSGRNLPVYASKKNRECSIDLKIAPMERLKKKLVKHLEESYGKTITMVGTRFAESKGRQARMEARGEDAESIWASDSSGDMLSPVANWSTEDVWDYLSAVSRGVEDGYSDFTGLMELYRDGSDQSDSDGEKKDCRFGCSICTVTSVDRSMANLLKNNPAKYSYMEGLFRLQQYLIAIQHDLDRRQYIGRSINEHGYIAIGADTFSPAQLEELFLMILTLDIREAEAADRHGIAPRFQLLHPRAIVAIDALWGMQGVFEPHHGLYLYKKVYHEGFRLDIPVIKPSKRVPIPEKRYLFVGDAWKAGEFNFSGMRNMFLEMSSEPNSFTGCGRTETLKDGRIVQSPVYSDDGLFDIDLESAYFVLDFELDYLLRKHNDAYRATEAYNAYVSMGTLQLSSRRQSSSSDMIMRRTAWREREGLVGRNFDLHKVIGRTISKKEMLAAVAAKQGEVIPIPVPEVQEETQQPLQLDLFQECA